MNVKSFVRPQFILWVTGIFFALGAVTYVKKSIISSISFFLLTVLTLPPFSNVWPSIIKKPINKSTKLLVGFLLFLIATKFTPSTDELTKIVTPELSPPLVSYSNPTITPTLNPSPTLIPTINPNLATVIKIVDGDTINVKIGGEEATVRLIGIDSPEVVDPRKSVQCFGKEASEKIKELINSKNVILTPDSTQDNKDKYSRLLRYVYLEDGTFINQKMIEGGYAYEYTYDIPYKYQTEFKEAQKQAESKKFGLWADNACPVLTPIPTTKPTSNLQLNLVSTVKPTIVQTKVDTYVAPLVQENISGSWACDCSKTCSNMSSCAEAQYQLNNCGCQARDGDDDGIACDSDCQ